jgi:hypothetical protein
MIRGSSSIRFMAIRNVRTVALGERYRGSADATAGPALVPFAVLFAGATSWLAKTGKEPKDPAPTRQITAMIGWMTPLNVDLPRSGPARQAATNDSYFVYLTCTFSIVPLNLNGALL